MRGTRCTGKRPGRAGGVVWLWLAAALPALSAAPAVPAGATGPGSTNTVYLEYRELDHLMANRPFEWWVVLHTTPFKKEPLLGPGPVSRGTIKFGDRTDQFVPFLWDQGQGKLYLDLNRNQDLTDDPDGVFACAPGLRSGSRQTFNKVRLTFPTASGSQRALVDLTLDGTRGPLKVFAACRYCWEGKLSLPGQDWQMALIDNLGARLGSGAGSCVVFRPWADRNQPLDGQPAAIEYFSGSCNLFIGQRAFETTCSPVQRDGRLGYQVQFKEYTEPLGEVKLTGQYIKSLVLRREGPSATGASPQAAPGRRYVLRSGLVTPDLPQPPSLVAVFDSPGPVLKLPLGGYQCRFTLERGGAQAMPLSQWFAFGQPAHPLVITATNAATLAVGGPLRNSVTVLQRGRTLVLNYQLVGVGGEPYTLLGERREPEFAIYRPGKNGDKKLAAGKFEFG